ncbi:MAG: arginine--tRNA ligase [Ardenticatenaceae bacterium]|nr:arginine--tRNA ligase [Ardenticatenaceae bacterium]
MMLSVRQKLTQHIEKSIRQLQEQGELPAFSLPEIDLERPQREEHGDLAANIALKLAKPAQKAPLEIAWLITQNIELPGEIASVSAAPPGFLNFQLADGYLQKSILSILEEGERFGCLAGENPQKIQVEFVSANPTGPITIGRSRGAVVGDTVARVLEAAGHQVSREYYFNDAGRQIVLLGESVKLRYQQLHGHEAKLSAEHYQGDYIVDLAQEIKNEFKAGWLDAPAAQFGNYAKNRIAQNQKISLKRIGIVHDVYFNEASLFTTGKLDETLNRLRENGFTYQTADGAEWLKTSALGDEKDRVIIRSEDQMPTYRLPDIAYHFDKAQRGFDLVIDVFGPDHQAVSEQVKMGLKMLNINPEFVTVLIHHVVTLVQDGRPVKMSTRAGQFVTLDELVNQVGADAVRYFMLSRSANSPIEFNLNLAVEKSSSNPVFYIQNAHVRGASILRKARAANLMLTHTGKADLSLINHPLELLFLKKALELPVLIQRLGQTYEVHQLTTYAKELSTAFHAAYENCRALGDDIPTAVQQARLIFYAAAQQVLANTLKLLGMTPMETM